MIMASLFGVVGDGFAVVAAGTSVQRSSYLFSNPDHDRVTRFGSHLILGVSGVPGDCLRVREEVRASVSTDSDKITTATMAADAARGAVLSCAHSANVMIAGYDRAESLAMYAVGGTAPPQRVEQYGAFGCGAALCTPVMESHYRPGMTVKEAVELVDQCIKQVRRLGLASFLIMVVDKDGTREYVRLTRPKLDMEKKFREGKSTVNSENNVHFVQM